MTFLKITDPAKRNELVQELINKRKQIYQDSFDERITDIAQQRDMSKIFKPITEAIGAVPAAPAPIRIINAIEAPPSLPSLRSSASHSGVSPAEPPSLRSDVSPAGHTDGTMVLGNIASEYLRNFASKSSITDKTFGIHDVDGKFHIGNKEVVFDNNDLIIDNKKYKGTIGLWELITSKQPVDSVITTSDLNTYKEILHKTSALKRNYDPDETHTKPSKSNKWNKLLGPIWTELYQKTMQGKLALPSLPSGESPSDTASPPSSPSLPSLPSLRSGESRSGVSGEGIQTIILPSDPIALLNRLDLLLASNIAGNTGVRNEVVAICDELLKQGIFDNNSYKMLMLKLK